MIVWGRGSTRDERIRCAIGCARCESASESESVRCAVKLKIGGSADRSRQRWAMGDEPNPDAWRMAPDS